MENSIANKTYYLCFHISTIPDLTLAKYSVFDGSGVENVMEKHKVFLRQLHRLGFGSGVYFHLLYFYDADSSLSNGEHLKIYFYATSKVREKLEGIREFLINSVLSNYYDFRCYEVSEDFRYEEQDLDDVERFPSLVLRNISGEKKIYGLNGVTDKEEIEEKMRAKKEGEIAHIVCEIASDADAVLSLDSADVDTQGRIIHNIAFPYMAFLTKKEYSIPAQNRLQNDKAGTPMLHSILEWEPCKDGRLFNVLKLMEGYNKNAAIRIDIFPVENTNSIRQQLPYAETRLRISDHKQGKDDNSEYITRSWDNYLNNLVKFPQFVSNIVAFSESRDIAVMLADSIGAEAVESGSYEVNVEEGNYDIYENDTTIVSAKYLKAKSYVSSLLSLYTLEEIRPMFSFPILYPGESIECKKETDPVQFAKGAWIDGKNTLHETISLGVSDKGYDVVFPVELFKKHAFIAGVPGSGKTNTMLHIVTSLWKNTIQKVPFLVLEPAKQEYRALLRFPEMQDVYLFSPGADTRFPLHINPFQFPIGLTLSEHIANLNAVFAGAFFLPPPSPHFIDDSIQKVYLNKGWNTSERNNGTKEYPTLQDLYDTLYIAVQESHYDAETLGNLRSVLEVRIGSLLKREIGNVYNVKESIILPEDWIKKPAIIELESLGEGPANFMSLLISTLIRESLKVKKLKRGLSSEPEGEFNREINHVIFYEEAHNLIGPETNSPIGDNVDPKISATKYLVKMLAEVRALNEGIVIADQLPTVMAAEVLKNTGLKIGHRITAQDDRELLGSTMSASADQIEEQDIFEVGKALIFYENLQKPYKMKVSEWERTGAKNRYESPSDDELVELLKNNEQYIATIRRSKEIMLKKIKREFSNLQSELSKISEKAKNKKVSISYDVQSRKKLSEKLTDLIDPEIISQTKTDIARLDVAIEGQKKDISEGLGYELRKQCREYASKYFAYMTLAETYSGICSETGESMSDELYMCAITEYLSLFKTLRLMSGIDELKIVLIEETKYVIESISEYIGIFSEQNGILSEHSEYKEAVLSASFCLANIIDSECIQMKKELANVEEVLKVSYEDAQQLLTELCRKVTEHCKMWHQAGIYHYNNALSLEKQVFEQLKGTKRSNFQITGQLKQKMERYSKDKHIVFLSLVPFICSFFKEVPGILKGKEFFDKETTMIRAILDEITGYRKLSRAFLSGSKNYNLIIQESYTAVLVDLRSEFRRIDNDSRETVLKGEKGEISGQEITERIHKTAYYSYKVFENALEKNSYFSANAVEYYTFLAYEITDYLFEITRIKDEFKPAAVKENKELWFMFYESIFKPLSKRFDENHTKKVEEIKNIFDRNNF